MLEESDRIEDTNEFQDLDEATKIVKKIIEVRKSQKHEMNLI